MAALAQAAEAAGDGDVAIGGDADGIRQALVAEKLDELIISTAPVILGAGKRLFDGFDREHGQPRGGQVLLAYRQLERFLDRMPSCCRSR